ncbi:hypothetical protein FRC05_010817 [Tulasnella sp. 425]|nr:hypothetical protein FRC05_010817 [Tulasnella sp. 425]
MTSEIDELEALLAALRLSFLTSSSTTSSPEALRQSIAVFRAALRPQGIDIVVASPSPTVAHMQKSDDGNHHVSQIVRQMDLVHVELRQGTDHIRELVQSVEELEQEVRDLRSAVVAPKSLANTKDHPPPSPPVIDAVEKCAIWNPVNQAQVKPSPSSCALGGSRSTPSMPTGPHPVSEVTTSSSTPSPIITARSFIPPKRPSPRVAPQLASGATPINSACSPRATEVTELPTLPHLRSGPPSPAPCPVAIPTPAQTLNTVPINPPYASRPPSLVPVPVNTPEAIPVSPESPKPALLDIKPKDCTDQTVARRTGKKGATRMNECKTRAPNDEEKKKVEDAKGIEDFVTAESRPKSPIIATAIRYFSTGEEGDLEFKVDTKITILDHVTTQVGWMYGETTETRRGIFPARYVREVSHMDIKDETKPGSKSPAFVEAIDG